VNPAVSSSIAISASEVIGTAGEASSFNFTSRGMSDTLRASKLVGEEVTLTFCRFCAHRV
jgi:hypothetical protein